MKGVRKVVTPFIICFLTKKILCIQIKPFKPTSSLKTPNKSNDSGKKF